ncbi:MAG TPA: UDP-N-acetylmuramoyl-L-alanyl-D-glutamate--2,6-diaminopimelate ligase [Chloroflexota bacterium]
MPKTLGELARAIPGARLVAGNLGTAIAAITHDSRAVTPGALFVALPGQRYDGTAFVPDAIRSGAVAVVSEREEPVPGVAWVRVRAARPALADLAAAWRDYPAERLRLVGVTGTDGKTTTTRLIGSLLSAAGRPCGWYTTADLRIGDAVRPNEEHHTTPEADRVQEVVAAIADAGAAYAVMEASSHALAQERLRGCAFDVGVFTNLSPEHLDYHGTLDAYLAAKARLFAMLSEPTGKLGPRYAVLNADQPASARLREVCTVPVVTYALDAPADVRAEAIEERSEGFRATIATGVGRWPLTTRFVGRHNVANWLAAVAVALREGVPVEAIQQAAPTIEPPPGRLQPVRRGQPFGVYVDFAHTPQALRAALGAVRGVARGRVLLAFGHAGNRTKANRPELGRIAAELADYFVITNDDAYPEPPADIAAAIEAGAREAGAVPGRQFEVVLDRRAAIRGLFERARPDDVVLLAGKGHEAFLHVERVAAPWSDVAVAAELLAELGCADAEAGRVD